MKGEIVTLTQLWYDIVGLDHHKDRDCHWYINTTYSYGNPPTYRVEHFGYILDDIVRVFPTYERAEVGLRDVLLKSIYSEVDWANEVLKDKTQWEEFEIKKAKDIVELARKAGL